MQNKSGMGIANAWLQVTDESGTGPRIWVVALVPVNAERGQRVDQAGELEVSYNVLRPAMRGCVAHEPPRMMLCLPSKKSAVESQDRENVWGDDMDVPV